MKYHDETTLFTIPYQKVGSAYYISDEPYFSSVPDLQATENQVPTKTWSDSGKTSDSVKKIWISSRNHCLPLIQLTVIR